VDIEDHFHDEHERHFAYARRDLPVEFLHWRVSAIGSNGLATPHHKIPPVSDARSAVIGQRDVYFPTVSELLATDIYLAERLVPGAKFTGPAVVQATTTTLVVNPGDEVAVLPDGGYELTIGIQSHSTPSRRRANVVTGTAS
jgi:N-methylhydantoinase A